MLKPRPRPRIPAQRHAAPFFAAANAGQLKLAYCNACGRAAHPGVSHCQHCLSDEFTWREASGRGTIYSYIVMNRSLHTQFPGGYAVCVVELEEGPRLVAEVADISPDQLRVGMAVQAELMGYEAERPPLRFVPSDRL
jgi:uncharacterized protein